MTQPDPGPTVREVFISHSDEDRVATDRLSAELALNGIPHWLSRQELVGAQQWHDEIGAALGRCDWFVLVLSDASTQSMWVKRELLFVLGERRYAGRIIPILLEDCRPHLLSWTLDQLQRIDFRESWEDGMRELLRVWGKGYKHTPSA